MGPIGLLARLPGALAGAVVASVLLGPYAAHGAGPSPQGDAGRKRRPSLEAIVNIYDNAFVPSEIQVPLGTKVTWVNHGLNVHTATSPGNWDSGPLRPNQSWSTTVESAGSLGYFCLLHRDDALGR